MDRSSARIWTGLLGGVWVIVGAVAQASAPHMIVPGVWSGDVRTLPLADAAPAGPRQQRPRRITHPNAPDAQSPGRPDPLLASSRAARAGGRAFSPAELNFDAQGDTGVEPPDTIGDIGSTHYVQAVNGGSGSPVTVYDKTTGAIVAGPFLMSSLWTAGGECTSGGGDPIVLYDALASRWIMVEFANSGNHLCFYLSRTSDLLAGGWLNYDFEVPEFPDYPKFGVWPDAYTITTNESLPRVYALDRGRMLAGLPVSFQRFTVPSLGGFNFEALTPADVDGATPPASGADSIFLRHVDDEIHTPGLADPVHDFIQVWSLHVDFATAANSTFALTDAVAVAEFDSSLTAVAQPAPGPALDSLREVIMYRVPYRNFGSHETLLGNLVTDVGGGHAGIRWFELRRSGGGWALYQEGTLAPDARNRWMGAVAMDGAGNVAMGYSITGAALNAGLRYTGRLAAETLGTLHAESTLVAGVGVYGGSRWGDYAGMGVDPIDDCHFWFTGEYAGAAGGWQTRIARFRFDAPDCVDTAAPMCGNGNRDVGEDCDGIDAVYCAGLCTAGCNCPVPSCGNNVTEVGEACDGSSAAACGAGGCLADCTCSLCPPSPSGGCKAALPGASRLTISDNVLDSKDKLLWSWKKGAATTLGELGTPVSGTTDYAICVYDGAGGVQPIAQAKAPGGGLCGARACWKATSTGVKYSDREATPAGLVRLSAKSGVAGKPAVKVVGKGATLPTPSLPLVLPVTVQVSTSDGTCWQAQYGVSSRNDASAFKATGP